MLLISLMNRAKPHVHEPLWSYHQLGMGLFDGFKVHHSYLALKLLIPPHSIRFDTDTAELYIEAETTRHVFDCV